MSIKKIFIILSLCYAASSLSACVVLLPFIEQDNPENASGQASSYAYQENCAISQDPIVHFFAPQPPGSLAKVKELQSPYPAGRQMSATNVPRMSKRERRLRTLIRQLEKGDEIGRTHAASDLGMMGSQAQPAIENLAYALKFDRSKWVRRAAARSLGKIGGRRGIPALEHAVHRDQNKYVAHSAERSLRRLQLIGM